MGLLAAVFWAHPVAATIISLIAILAFGALVHLMMGAMIGDPNWRRITPDWRGTFTFSLFALVAFIVWGPILWTVAMLTEVEDEVGLIEGAILLGVWTIVPGYHLMKWIREERARMAAERTFSREGFFSLSAKNQEHILRLATQSCDKANSAEVPRGSCEAEGCREIKNAAPAMCPQVLLVMRRIGVK